MDDKTGCMQNFIIWLSNSGLSRKTIDEYIFTLNAVSQYCSKYTAFNIWDITKPKQVDDIVKIIELDKSEGKYLPIIYNDIPLHLLKSYLKIKSGGCQSKNENELIDKDVIIRSDYKQQLDNITVLLRKKYSKNLQKIYLK